MILVVGSTGKLGRAIVWRLRQEGIAVLALVRRTSNGAVLRGSGPRSPWGDLRDIESLMKACSGCRAVITTASLRSRFDLERIDRDGNLNLMEAAMREKVGHFVFVAYFSQAERKEAIDSLSHTWAQFSGLVPRLWRISAKAAAADFLQTAWRALASNCRAGCAQTVPKRRFP